MKGRKDEMATETTKTDNGPCVVCGKKTLYLGCQYCSPQCNMLYIRQKNAESEIEKGEK
jgi:hypothetical protein